MCPNLDQGFLTRKRKGWYPGPKFYSNSCPFAMAPKRRAGKHKKRSGQWELTKGEIVAPYHREIQRPNLSVSVVSLGSEEVFRLRPGCSLAPMQAQAGTPEETESCKGLAWNLVGDYRQARTGVEGQWTFDGNRSIKALTLPIQPLLEGSGHLVFKVLCTLTGHISTGNYSCLIFL